jgi:hypothetical protein
MNDSGKAFPDKRHDWRDGDLAEDGTGDSGLDAGQLPVRSAGHGDAGGEPDL